MKLKKTLIKPETVVAEQEKKGLWDKILQEIKQNLSRPSYETWFSSTLSMFDDDTFTIYAPNHFTADWLETRYDELIANAIHVITGQTYKRKYVVKGNSNGFSPSEKPKQQDEKNAMDMILHELKELNKSTKEMIEESRKIYKILISK